LQTSPTSNTTEAATAPPLSDTTAELSLFSKAYNLYNKGEYEEAIEYFDKMLQLDPNNVYTLIGKGNSFIYLGKYVEALVYYDKVLAIDPDNIRALNGKGSALDDLGK